MGQRVSAGSPVDAFPAGSVATLAIDLKLFPMN
jgi:hypothetical protein